MDVRYWTKNVQYDGVQCWLFEEKTNQDLFEVKHKGTTPSLKDELPTTRTHLHNTPCATLTTQEGLGFKEQVAKLTVLRTCPLPQVQTVLADNFSPGISSRLAT